eukprot:TRINITY_DN28561_c0_g1_i2.p1 TRINITY_DN28561_c0_g1~~TRINITY_DN28561_c0_g1_i2.p1  ORF type:complete len:201 (+),score=74.77 TRINITY_DN28561_c0_g1_i2:41-604(+)
MESRHVFVSNVADAVTEANLRELFACCGHILSFTKQWDVGSKRMGWRIDYRKASEAKSAAMLNGRELVGTALSVDYAGTVPVYDPKSAPVGVGLLEGPTATSTPFQDQMAAPGGAADMLLALMKQAKSAEGAIAGDAATAPAAAALERDRRRRRRRSSSESLSSSSAKRRRRARRRQKEKKRRRERS